MKMETKELSGALVLCDMLLTVLSILLNLSVIICLRDNKVLFSHLPTFTILTTSLNNLVQSVLVRSIEVVYIGMGVAKNTTSLKLEFCTSLVVGGRTCISVSAWSICFLVWLTLSERPVSVKEEDTSGSGSGGSISIIFSPNTTPIPPTPTPTLFAPTPATHTLPPATPILHTLCQRTPVPTVNTPSLDAEIESSDSCDSMKTRHKVILTCIWSLSFLSGLSSEQVLDDKREEFDLPKDLTVAARTESCDLSRNLESKVEWFSIILALPLPLFLSFTGICLLVYRSSLFKEDEGEREEDEHRDQAIEGSKYKTKEECEELEGSKYKIREEEEGSKYKIREEGDGSKYRIREEGEGSKYKIREEREGSKFKIREEGKKWMDRKNIKGENLRQKMAWMFTSGEEVEENPVSKNCSIFRKQKSLNKMSLQGSPRRNKIVPAASHRKKTESLYSPVGFHSSQLTINTPSIYSPVGFHSSQLTINTPSQYNKNQLSIPRNRITAQNSMNSNPEAESSKEDSSKMEIYSVIWLSTWIYLVNIFTTGPSLISELMISSPEENVAAFLILKFGLASLKTILEPCAIFLLRYDLRKTMMRLIKPHS
ncbi:uncharacterized protein LOC111713300 isoform X2 [Eurytemora carolleeae]|uniref:uncharacterized protein LOC111713300 isoform X2 n=1 Tax=Eurytemora carolleeae TaxID=1294199 RepID=UPI000C77028C|nr:uncharacterized protein LOC111713300 isoform X2 [Eurytemora carolleeae]|eukprot:XP_023343906.1 uncharacterized protein LOC111713300 isoform X2 [Eurytemora affinis]